MAAYGWVSNISGEGEDDALYLRRHPGYREVGASFLWSRLKEKHALGYRRFMFHMPQSVPDVPSGYSGPVLWVQTLWSVLDTEARRLLFEAPPPWSEGVDLEFEIYTGSRIPSPSHNGAIGHTQSWLGSVLMDLTNPVHRTWLEREHGPLLEAIRRSPVRYMGMVLDSGVDHTAGELGTYRDSYFTGMRLGVEPVPVVDLGPGGGPGGRTYGLDHSRLSAYRDAGIVCHVTLEYLRWASQGVWGNPTTDPPPPEWQVGSPLDPTRPVVYAVIQAQDSATTTNVNHLVSAGYYLGSMDGVSESLDTYIIAVAP